MKLTTKKKTNQSLAKGLKKVHIGADIWLYGKQKHVSGKGMHMVIYGPDRKEYHVWGNTVDLLCTDYDEYTKEWIRSNVDRHGNCAIHSKVKIYILTNILDNKENWCFDLTKIPANGPLKVICINGTVKNIEFTGKFLDQELVSKRFTWKAGSYHGIWPEHSYTTQKFVKIVGYRKN